MNKPNFPIAIYTTPNKEIELTLHLLIAISKAKDIQLMKNLLS